MRCGYYKRTRVICIICILSLSICSYATAWAWRAPVTRDNRYNSKALFVRGGSSEETIVPADDAIDDVSSAGVHAHYNDDEHDDEHDDDEHDDDEQDDDDEAPEKTILSESPQPQPRPFQFSFATRKIKQREASDFIQDLIRRSGVDGNEESQDLRNLITRRTQEYLNDLHDCHNSMDRKDSKLPHPRKLLHYLAPKIPAIKHSRDVELCIQSARSDMDCGVAASLIGILAHVCEVYDSVAAARVLERDEDTSSHYRSSVSAAVEMVKDRRFEQLVECVLCGVDVKKRKREHLRRQQQNKDGDANLEDIEHVIKEEDVKIDEGLSIRDSCRAAWGFAVLGVNRQISIAGEGVMDILVALSLRTRELLLARLQLLITGSDAGDEPVMLLTIDERLEELSEEVAEDAATAMWAFACVRACTGMTSVALLEVCSSILCQDPFELRRRAQEVETTLEATNVGSNDAVYRLAKSEADMRTEESGEADMTTITEATDAETKDDDIIAANNIVSQSSLVEKDALIDWLSPVEVTDVLWAVALHGHRSKDEDDAISLEEVALSETVAVLKEIAFDRLGEWLREELTSLEFREAERLGPLEQAEEEMLTVEVVDAATLLASENAAIANGPPVENVGEKGSLQQIPVVDAKSLLSAERDIAYNNPDALASTSIIVTDEIKSASDGQSELACSSTHRLDFERAFKPISFPFSSLHFFSPHDLCSLAWVVTELQDPLRHSVVDLISKIFLRLGMSGLVNTNGSDLSNLAWALSKQATGDVITESIGAEYPPVIVMEWVLQIALVGLSDRSDDLNSAADRILQRFEPPELSRLLWAVGSIHSRRNDISGKGLAMDAAGNAAVVGLLAASSDMSIFGTEDLARIMWAFLEVSDLEQVLSQPLVADALGRVLSTVETSLLQWESGSGCYAVSTDSVNKESTRFASFFGRSRFHIPFLDHKDDESEDVDESHPRPLKGKKHLPLLRDLPIDPSTLCKAACSFAILPLSYPAIKGSETLLRIALRLLTSRNGRLLQECPRQDVIRLCEAVATNESPYGREQIGLFTRRVVRLLNESDEESADSLSSNSPRDIACLVWSLGELGVKHQPGQIDTASAHRRLQLVRELPFLSEDQVRSLPSVFVTRLFHGLVAMNVMDTDKPFLLDVLRCVSTIIPFLEDGSQYCDIVESLGVLKASLDAGAAGSENVTVVELDLAELSETMLSAVAVQTMEHVGSLSAVELRRLLTVYSLSPFKSDAFVNSIETEVTRRLELLDSHASRERGRDLLWSAASSARTVISAFTEESADGGSALCAIKNGLRSMFRQSNVKEHASNDKEDASDDNPDDREEESVQESLQIEIERALHSIVEAADYLERSGDASRDQVIQRLEVGVLFELGRCRQLAEHYRRIDFDDSGSSTSRFDQDRRRVMVKRVLSRLHP